MSTIPKLTPELMFKQLERLEQRLKVAKTSEEAKALYERITIIETFIDNCALATLTDVASELKIDTRLFDLPLLTSFISLPEGSEMPRQLAMDFNEPIDTTTKEQEDENPIVDLEEVIEQTDLKLDFENEDIKRIVNGLVTGLTKTDDFQKHIYAAVNVLRKKVEIPAEVDDFSVLNALIKHKPLYELVKFHEYAKHLHKKGLDEGHALGCILDVKAKFKNWSDDAIANMVRTLIVKVSPDMHHHYILDADRKKISSLLNDEAFVSQMSELWPEVRYCRTEKSTGNLIEELLPCTEKKAAGFHIGHLYGLCSLKKQAQLAHRKIYVEKGYPA